MTALAISAVGLASSLGLNSAEACAAARAGLVRVSQIDALNTANDPGFCKETLDGIPPFVGHLVPAVGTGYTGLAKLLALARPALLDLLNDAALGSEELSRTGLCLCLSDGFYTSRFGELPDLPDEAQPPGPEQIWHDIASRLAGRLCESAGLAIDASRQWVSTSGRLALLGALQQATRWLKSGTIDRCIVGTLESLTEAAVLQACAAANVLKTDANPVGFMPGEAAAFFLLQASPADAPGSTPLRIVSMAHATDVAYHEDSVQPQGRGISHVALQAMAAGEGGPPALLITDLNGTEARAFDWGHALAHLRERWGDFQAPMWMPVESFGETGAATGGVALCMAFEAARRGHVHSQTALLVLCGESGGRGALMLETHPIHH